MKKTLSILLSILLLLGTVAFAVPAFAADDMPVLSGTCGDNITWKLEDGTLTISGEGVLAPQPVVGEPYEYDSWDSTTQTWEKCTTTPSTELHYPWDKDAIAAYYGYADWNDAVMGVIAGEGITYADLLYTPLHVKKIVVEEGITAIVGSAFDWLQPETVILPATLEAFLTEWTDPQTGEQAHGIGAPTFKGITLQNIIIKNPDMQINGGFEIGCTKEAGRFATYDAFQTAIESFLDVYTETVWPTYFIGQCVYFDMGRIYGALHGAYLYEYRVTQEGAAAFIPTYLEMIRPGMNRIGIYYTNLDSYLTAMLTRVNELLHTAFTSIEELFTIDETIRPINNDGGGMPTVEYSPAFEAALASMEEDFEAFAETAGSIAPTFEFGKLPQTEQEDGADPQPLYPYPWITVYGLPGSTAEAAAATSGVNFVAICPTEHAGAAEVAETRPTAAAHGYTAGVFCPDCNTWLSGHEVIHNQRGDREVVKEATETEEGEVYIVCTVCGESGLYALEKLPHTEPQPEQPSDNGGSPNFFERIRLFAKSIVDWFLRLIRWIGKR